MASIKDAFEESLQDEHAITKFIIFAIPLFYCTKFLVEPDKLDYLVITLLVTGILYLGFTLKCTKNVRGSKNFVLPAFNIFSLLIDGIKGIIALAPLIIIATTLDVFIAEALAKVFINPDTLNIFVAITTALCNSIIYTGYILYAKDFKVADVYNFSMIGKYCADILIAVIFMKIKLLIVNLILMAPVTYLVWIFFGLPHPIATFYGCVVAVFNLAIMGHYMAQIHYETIEESEDKNLVL